MVGERRNRDAQGDFTERFGRGKLTIRGAVLPVKNVVGRQQMFGKLLKRLM